MMKECTTTTRGLIDRFHPFAAMLRTLLDRLAADDGSEAARRDLERLDDRTLADIGATRADVDAELRRLG